MFNHSLIQPSRGESSIRCDRFWTYEQTTHLNVVNKWDRLRVKMLTSRTLLLRMNDSTPGILSCIPLFVFHDMCHVTHIIYELFTMKTNTGNLDSVT